MTSEQDFSKASFTVIVSDLHLCEAEPPNSRSPLWKKFKTKEFFFDDEFSAFVESVCERAGASPVEMIFNGDTFDFDSFMLLPERPTYRVSWLEKRRGLRPEEPKSLFKIKVTLEHHELFVKALRKFLARNPENKIVFIVGNHDVELHFSRVQEEILSAICPDPNDWTRVRFCEWFYISNKDTLIEHGNQYDPYCLCQDPINPMVLKFNRIEVRLPFGNLAGRYMTNGMGFFNPHVDTNFIMTLGEYLRFFFKYMLRAQPLLLWTWFWGAVVTLWQAFADRLRPALKDPLMVEDKVEEIARRSNATPRMVRELKELTLEPAASDPVLVARELWLDRAFGILVALVVFFQIFSMIKLIYEISLNWMLIPLALFLPVLIFYSQAFSSKVTKYKEPDEKILTLAGRIANVGRVIYGHTHIPRHEWIGSVEHLNSGTWSAAFMDPECTRPLGKKTYVWISPSSQGRQAQLLVFDPTPKNGGAALPERIKRQSA